MNFDVLIVGGGMVGASLACALGNGALKVGLLDRSAPAPSPEHGYDLRVSAVTLASRAFLENIGAWEGIARRRVAPVEAMHVWDRNGHGSIHFDAAEIGAPCLAYIVENRVIQAALIERLNRLTNIHYLCPVDTAELALGVDRVSVALADGRRLHARLLVGADGAESAVRRAAGIDTRSLDLDQKGIVATVTTERPHANIARQRFLDTGPLAFLPLPDPRACSIVWSADARRADELLALDDAAFGVELECAIGGALGGIESIGPRAGFPLTLAHARAYTAPRVALAGDAAHTVHPLAGQGVNLGFLDAAALAEVLLDADAAGKDIGAHAVLRRYERWRKGGNLAMVSLTGAFRYLFGNNLPGVRALRNLGLDLADSATPIRRFLMRRASGLEGDLPRLARARAH